MFGRHRARRAVLLALATAASAVGLNVADAGASVFPASGGAVYKEYWVSHAVFTGGCPEHDLYVPSNGWFIEPGPCTKVMNFTIPDNVSRVAKVEIYLDLWRNYTGTPAARFKLNNGPIRTPPVGYDWSRTPWIAELPIGELKQGTNTITFYPNSSGKRYHVHDIGFRVHHTAANPLVAGPGSDVTPPEVSLGSITAQNGVFAPGAGGTLQVSNDQLGLTATSTGAKQVEFFASHDGYDDDNNGVTNDWKGIIRNNWNPGGGRQGPSAPPTGSTVGVVGIDMTSPYGVAWNLHHVISQPGVRFKARAIDAAGNVRETPASAPFTLARSFATSHHRIPNFVDLPLYANGSKPTSHTVTIHLPSLAGVSSAYIVGHYWQNPFIKINNGTPFKAFNSGEDVWQQSIRSIPVSQLRAGANTITYSYNSAQIRWGQFVERPGPLIVLRGGTPRTDEPVPQITQQPAPVSATVGGSATFSVAATSVNGPVTFQWRRDGNPIDGAVGASYTLSPVAAGDNGAVFDVVISDGVATVTSEPAALTVGGTGPSGRTVTIEDGVITEADTAEGVVVVFRIVLDQVHTQPVSVTLATNDTGSATPVSDYLRRTPSVVTIPAGQRYGYFGVRVVSDNLDEPNETLGVVMSAPSGATIVDADGVGTIIDDD